MHNSNFNVTLGEIVDEFKLKEVNKTENMRDVLVCNNEVNRCGRLKTNCEEYDFLIRVLLGQ